jgi:hypothetical protein
MVDSTEDELWDIWEEFLETRLFRDANDPEVNRLLQTMHAKVLAVANREDFVAWADRSKAVTWAGKKGLKERWLHRDDVEYQLKLGAEN